MIDIKLGPIETRFAEIIWANEPLTTNQLTKLCAEALEWKRTTTYTVLKKLCLRGIFDMSNSMVTVLITKDQFQTLRSQQFVGEHFGGSLPAFIAAFTAQKPLSEKELAELKAMIRNFEEK